MSKIENHIQETGLGNRYILGQNLQNLRLEAGLSRKDVGNILKITVQQVQKYESGKNRLSTERLYVLKHVFDIPYERFFDHLDLAQENLRGKLASRDPIAQDIYERVLVLDNQELKRKVREIVRVLAS